MPPYRGPLGNMRENGARSLSRLASCATTA
jgi:hypothetical protein